MDYKVNNKVFQSVSAELEEGETLFAESGKLLSMSPNIEIDTHIKGGLFKGLKRSITGESLFMIDFKCTEGSGYVSFASEIPGQLVAVELEEGQTRICQRDSFIAAESTVDLDVKTMKLGTALFGGEGLFLQKLTGPGTCFVNIGGEMEKIELDEGQRIKADIGSVAMYDESVDFDIERIKGIKNMLFGGESIFLASLKGPGTVWLQTINIADLRAKIAVTKGS